MTNPSRPPGGGGPILLTRQIAIHPSAYLTGIPLIVAERCRSAGHYDDGAKAEPPALLMTWYALRWLMAAFPDRRGFGQRAIARIAGYDQKSVHRRLRKLNQLGLVVEVGREVYPHLRGQGTKPGKGKPKEQPIYSIPEHDLISQSSREAPSIIERWGAELFGPKTPEPQPAPEAQLALDLSDPIADQTDPVGDQSLDPVADQTDPIGDQTSDPLSDQTDPVGDQSLDPLEDHASDPLPDHMEGGKEGRREERDALTRFDPDSRTVPPAPAGEQPLPLPLFELWRTFAPSVNPLADRILLGRLAADHDEPTGGHGAYWVGRAILAAGLRRDVKDWLGFLRKTLDRWRLSEAYGSELPKAERPPRVYRPGVPSQSRAVGEQSPGEPTSQKVSDLEILTHPNLTNHERQRWLTRFRSAPLQERPAVLERFRKEHPLEPPNEQAAAD